MERSASPLGGAEAVRLRLLLRLKEHVWLLDPVVVRLAGYVVDALTTADHTLGRAGAARDYSLSRQSRAAT